MADILKFPAPPSIDEILAELPEPEPGLIATREEREARFKALIRDCDARRARSKFSVVS